MLYATTAHVANDWLAVGASAFFFAALADGRSPLRVAAWLTVGLLAKAYFLVFAAFAAGVMLWQFRARVRAPLPAAALMVAMAVPWYARNLLLYGSAGGSPEALNGIGIRQALAAARRIDWPATAGYLARASLWTGNNWFNSYSRSTLNVLLALLAVGMVAWIWHRRAARSAEWTIFAAVVVFLAAVVYEGCAMVADRPDQAVAGPSPWYTQVLLAPVVALAYLGLARWKRVGRVLAGVTITLWAWILVATWTLKLFPMYSGGGSSAVRVREVWAWWTHDAAAHARVLSVTSLAPAAWLYAGLAVALVITVGVWGLVMRALRDR
jgi:hypothetical protein